MDWGLLILGNKIVAEIFPDFLVSYGIQDGLISLVQSHFLKVTTIFYVGIFPNWKKTFVAFLGWYRRKTCIAHIHESLSLTEVSWNNNGISL